MTSDGIDFFPAHVEQVDWSTGASALSGQRAPWCNAGTEAEDAMAFHYLATRNGEAIGYLRVDAGGELSCIGAEGNALDIHQALLRFAMMDAPLHDLARLWAPAADPWQTLLPDLGFAPSSHTKGHLDYFPPPHRTKQATGSELVRLEHMEELRQFSLELVKHAKRSVVIYSEDLEAWLYDNEEFFQAIVVLIHNSQFSTVRLLVRDTRALQERGHRLLKLCHHANEHVSIRKITVASNIKQPAYLIVDDNGLLFRPDGAALSGIGYLDYRARVKTLLAEFDLMWNTSHQDQNLRQMTM